MDLKEAYRVMQEASGIRVGDKVKCLRHFGKNELGSTVSTSDLFKKRSFVDDGSVGTVSAITNSTVTVECGEKYGYGWTFPFFVLEVIEKAKTIRCETRYFDENNKDVTGKISEETKRNLKEN